MVLGHVADLPAEVQQVLPADPQAQLEWAFKIIQFAHTQKVAQMEAESQQLREAVIGKQNAIKSLERRVNNLEGEVQELLAKNKTAVEEQHKLQAEKGALIDTVKKLNREIAKLEAFKRSLIQHLQEEEDEPAQLSRSQAAVDLNSERLVADVLNSANKQLAVSSAGPADRGGTSAGGAPPGVGTPASGAALGGGFGGAANHHHQHHAYHSGTAHGSSRPGPSPGAGGGPASKYGSPPRHYSASPSYTAQQSGVSGGAGASGGPGSGGIDGKEFFRQARARLSYEQFTDFLNAIKDLNANRQTREDTLRVVQDICGAQHADLYVLFESLLSKHLTTF